MLSIKTLYYFVELPPSAAQEPPPTPKNAAGKTQNTGQNKQITHSSTDILEQIMSNPTSSIGSQDHQQQTAGPSSMFNNNNIALSGSGSSGTTHSIGSPQASMISHNDNTSDPVLPININTSSNHSRTSFPSFNPLSPSALTDTNLSDPLPGNLPDLPFITMEWSDSDSNMNTFDLPDMLDTPSFGSLPSHDRAGGSKDFLGLPSTSGGQGGSGSVHGSEPNLSGLGIGDGDFSDPNSAVNMDVSDWLDVMIPSTGLTPLSANAPVSFSGDPILTPKPQDVLDLFNMEESDLYTPSDLTNNPFEKPMETATTHT